MAKLSGSGGTVKLPFPFHVSGAGDTPVFTAPDRITVHVDNFHGDPYCDFNLHDATDGTVFASKRATPDNPTVTFMPDGRRKVYLSTRNCNGKVSPGR